MKAGGGVLELPVFDQLADEFPAGVLLFLFFAGLAALALAFAVASVQARVGWRVLAALAVAPFFILWKLVIQLKSAVRLRGGLKEFGATERR